MFKFLVIMAVLTASSFALAGANVAEATDQTAKLVCGYGTYGPNTVGKAKDDLLSCGAGSSGAYGTFSGYFNQYPGGPDMAAFGPVNCITMRTFLIQQGVLTLDNQSFKARVQCTSADTEPFAVKVTVLEAK